MPLLSLVLAAASAEEAAPEVKPTLPLTETAAAAPLLPPMRREGRGARSWATAPAAASGQGLSLATLAAAAWADAEAATDMPSGAALPRRDQRLPLHALHLPPLDIGAAGAGGGGGGASLAPAAPKSARRGAPAPPTLAAWSTKALQRNVPGRRTDQGRRVLPHDASDAADGGSAAAHFAYDSHVAAQPDVMTAGDAGFSRRGGWLGGGSTVGAKRRSSDTGAASDAGSEPAGAAVRKSRRVQARAAADAEAAEHAAAQRIAHGLAEAVSLLEAPDELEVLEALRSVFVLLGHSLETDCPLVDAAVCGAITGLVSLLRSTPAREAAELAVNVLVIMLRERAGARMAAEDAGAPRVLVALMLALLAGEPGMGCQQQHPDALLLNALQALRALVPGGVASADAIIDAGAVDVALLLVAGGGGVATPELRADAAALLTELAAASPNNAEACVAAQGLRQLQATIAATYSACPPGMAPEGLPSSAAATSQPTPAPLTAEADEDSAKVLLEQQDAAAAAAEDPRDDLPPLAAAAVAQPSEDAADMADPGTLTQPTSADIATAAEGQDVIKAEVAGTSALATTPVDLLAAAAAAAGDA